MKIFGKPNSLHFAKPYADAMGVQMVETNNHYEIMALANQQDISWLEWGNDLTYRILKQRLLCKVIVRVHDWEVRKEFVKRINWKNADCIWFINKEVQQHFNRLCPGYEEKQIFLPNAIDMDLFKITPHEFNYSIAMCSTGVTGRKNYQRAIELMRLLTLEDSRYKLTIRTGVQGGSQKEIYKKCLALINQYGLKDNVIFEIRNFDIKDVNEKEDINKFYSDKDIILSTSRHEGFHYAISEGMACGLMPAIYNWEFGGAKDFWPSYHVRDNIEDLKNLILSAKENTEAYRDYVKQKYCSKILSNRLLTLI